LASALNQIGHAYSQKSGIITKELWVLQDDGTAKLRIDNFEVQG